MCVYVCVCLCVCVHLPMQILARLRYLMSTSSPESVMTSNAIQLLTALAEHSEAAAVECVRSDTSLCGAHTRTHAHAWMHARTHTYTHTDTHIQTHTHQRGDGTHASTQTK